MNNNKSTTKLSDDNTSSLPDLVLSTATEVPCPLIIALLIDRKEFGRKNFLIGAFLLAGVFLVILFILNGIYFVYLAAAAKFFLLMTFTLAYQFTVEVYNT